MKVRSFYGTPKDKKLIHDICFNCGSKAVKSSYSYIRFIAYLHPDKIIFDIFDEIALFFGYKCKNHIRCIIVAVLKDYQSAGIGKEILFFEKVKAKKQGINKITCRTSKAEGALKFWQAIGVKIIGEKGDDWEMCLNF